jgi:hypothetical protein
MYVYLHSCYIYIYIYIYRHLGMMQDYPKLLSPSAKVGFTTSPAWICYSPCKNNPTDAAASAAAGIYELYTCIHIHMLISTHACICICIFVIGYVIITPLMQLLPLLHVPYLQHIYLQIDISMCIHIYTYTIVFDTCIYM